MAAFIKENTVFQDIDGEPLVNGLLYIGANGSDPVSTAGATTIFSDRELTIALANPQTLDDFGQSTNKIWIDGKYSLQVNNSNGVQKFQDLDAGETTESGITSLSNVQGTNTITAEAATTITAYVDKEIYAFTVENTNTGPVTLNIDGVGAQAIVKNINDPLAAGDFVANEVVLVVFNTLSTDFTWINKIEIQDYVNNFRLSLVTGVPVTTADVSGIGTIFMTPYTGNSISLYTGTEWITVTLAELSVVAPAIVDKVFDVFLDYNAGTPQLVTTDWTNDTDRATTLTTQDGVLVQTGNTDFRYLGTATTKTASQVDDSIGFRHLWNYYNRVPRPMQITESTDTWTYKIPTLRQANANTANQLDFVIGVSEDLVSANVVAAVSSTDVGPNQSFFSVGIGLDSTSLNAATTLNSELNNSAIGGRLPVQSYWQGYPGIGRHFLAWLEQASVASGDITWSGDNGAPLISKNGIMGTILS